jgi:hypothetical protein
MGGAQRRPRRRRGSGLTMTDTRREVAPRFQRTRTISARECPSSNG